MPPQPKTVLLIDFDGTIVTADTAQVALDRFANPDWVLIDRAYEGGEVSFEESLRREFAMLQVPEDAIIDEVKRVTELRPNFDRLVTHCRTNQIPLKVVSGGLDFCIRHFLDRDDWLKFIEIHAPHAKFNGNGYSLTFPELHTSSSTNFKDDLVNHEREIGAKVLFVGNGSGDFPAARQSDFAFAIKASRLAELCRKHGVQHEEIDDFYQVVRALEHRFREVQ